MGATAAGCRSLAPSAWVLSALRLRLGSFGPTPVGQRRARPDPPRRNRPSRELAQELSATLAPRVYPRADFLRLLHKHRGRFRAQSPEEAVDSTFRPLKAGDECAATVLLELPRRAPAPVP
ncbi:unnamed protein product [Prorocentrum cordatum]|uniref:Uncharacterized protein n=1 Tax=Prorocentrum cordatum TaxID=2364126 RepID=A0ABN9TDK6_9DINO|nr:unnamed protein product [Polarella glacialis]